MLLCTSLIANCADHQAYPREGLDGPARAFLALILARRIAERQLKRKQVALFQFLEARLFVFKGQL